MKRKNLFIFAAALVVLVGTSVTLWAGLTPEEVALTAQFLCSEAGTGVVGHTLVVDGGAGIVE